MDLVDGKDKAEGKHGRGSLIAPFPFLYYWGIYFTYSILSSDKGC